MTTATASIAPLEVRGISLRFGRRPVLRGVDLDVAPGEIVGLVGANGAGKTTLFQIITGLADPDGGALRFGGVEVLRVGLELRAKLGYVTHRPQVYAGLSARENLELSAALRASAGLATLAADPLLTRFGLEGASDRPAATFSRGMAQRLVLARALAARPELLLLDEPFTALDRDGRALLAEALAEERSRGAAILLSSHEIDALAHVADRVLFLHGGVIAGAVTRGAQTAETFAQAILDGWRQR